MEVITASRRYVLRRFFEDGPRHEVFFLAGGTALALFEFQHRRSDDLDLFTCDPAAIKACGEQLRGWAISCGFEIELIIPGDDRFKRFEVRSAGEATKVDLAWETAQPLGPVRVLDGIRFESRRDLLASKVATFWSRREMKDAVDLFFILRDSGEELAGLFQDAMKKEAGFDVEGYAAALGTWTPVPAALSFLETYMIKRVSIDEMTTLFAAASDRLKESLP